jgi:hypothetical protein
MSMENLVIYVKRRSTLWGGPLPLGDGAAGKDAGDRRMAISSSAVAHGAPPQIAAWLRWG